jgi:superfamily I DNA and/or RNA helicase
MAQRRMPQQLADFVSRAFYSGVLRTEYSGGTADPIFTEPFALIDTTDRTAAARAERAVRRDEEFGLRGYVNPLEASLIVELVTQYVRWYPDWAVIVPYRAQAEGIAEQLATAIGDVHAVADFMASRQKRC